MLGLVRVQVEPGYWYEVAGGNHTVGFNEFDNYNMHDLILPNIDLLETEIYTIA